jgi:hypothetical protein
VVRTVRTEFLNISSRSFFPSLLRFHLHLYSRSKQKDKPAYCGEIPAAAAAKMLLRELSSGKETNEHTFIVGCHDSVSKILFHVFRLASFIY